MELLKHVYKHMSNTALFKVDLISIITLLAIFLTAFLPRVISLGVATTTDELLWLVRSPNFIDAIMQHNWAATYQAPHPGVTTMWLSGASLEFLYNNGMDYTDKLFVARLPIAFATSIGVVLIYVFVKELFNNTIGILCSIFVSLDPFYIAHSRCIHLDAMLTNFMILSVLAFLVHLNHPYKKRYILLAGFLQGLSFLTKQPSLFLIPYLFIIASIWTLFGDRISSESFIQNIRQNSLDIIKIIIIILFISAITFVILWPSMWVNPIDTISKMILNQDCGTLKAVLEPHGSGFFMGKISDGSFGPAFYPVVLLMRSTPIVLVLSVIFIVYYFKSIVNNVDDRTVIVSAFLIYIILFITQMTFSGKKLDRYILPVFPMLDIIAALGLYSLTYSLTDRLSLIKSRINKKVVFTITIIIIFVQITTLMAVHPYYLSYFNPAAFGGPSNAPNILLVGWGEGMDLAAAYLNNKDDAKNLTVAAQYAGFKEHFIGNTIEINLAAYADYVVFYITAVQRDWNSDVWDRYKNETPEKTVIINNIEYCWIYKNRKILQLPGIFIFNYDNAGSSEYSFVWGNSTDRLFVGDWNGDGKDTAGLFRPSEGRWYFNYNNAGPSEYSFVWGDSTDIPVVGDWNGDGKDEAGLYRPSTQTWYFNYDNAGGSEYSLVWGDSTDIPVVGDWNGDGKDEVGLYRPSTRRWYFNYDNTGGSEYSFVWGDGTDIPVVGDWNGDGKDTAGLFRPSNR